MKNINLLPRKPLVNQIFVPLLITMVASFLGCSILLLFYSFNTNMNIDAERSKVDQANARIAELTALHQVDPRTQDYNNFMAALQQAKAARRDWTPIFELITKNLYKSSRLISMDVNDKEMISLKLEFTALNEVAYYSILLQNSVLVQQISIKDISHAKKVLIPSPTSQPSITLPIRTESILPSGKTGAGKTGPSIQTSTLIYYSVSLDIQLKSLVKGK